MSPNELLTRNIRPNASVDAVHNSTEIAEPYASHDHAGWRRRGDHRNSRAIAAPTSTSASGQRTMSQTVRASLPIKEPISGPNAKTTNAAAAHAPAVTVSSNARPYFRGVGRSCSTP